MKGGYHRAEKRRKMIMTKATKLLWAGAMEIIGHVIAIVIIVIMLVISAGVAKAAAVGGGDVVVV